MFRLLGLSIATNFNRRLEKLVDHCPWTDGVQWSTLTPNEYICKIWISERHRFVVDPIHQMLGLNI